MAVARRMSDTVVSYLRFQCVFGLVLGVGALVVAAAARAWDGVALAAVLVTLLVLALRHLLRYQPQPDRPIWKRRGGDSQENRAPRGWRLSGLAGAVLWVAVMVAFRASGISLDRTWLNAAAAVLGLLLLVTTVVDRRSRKRSDPV